jgi:hypothetical protein
MYDDMDIRRLYKQFTETGCVGKKKKALYWTAEEI